ncbi:MAG: hypothetical protein GXP42_13020 [Chloroflexi bacterium]|nr:hypothetical protein [Chloroflexota bacterium]
MTDEVWKENIIEQRVVFTMMIGDKVLVVEDVPARVNVDTGERYFAPDTVEQLQRMAWEEGEPVRVVEAPVYKFEA